MQVAVMLDQLICGMSNTKTCQNGNALSPFGKLYFWRADLQGLIFLGSLLSI
jgi:hypothetical protein